MRTTHYTTVTGEGEVSVTLQPNIRLRIHALFFVAIVLALAGCGGSDAAETATAPVVTAAAGGMALPPATLTATQTVDVTATVTATVAALLPGQQVRPLTTAVRLYVDASRQAPVMNQYALEAIFTLLEPSGDYAGYPVEAEGERWYRVRAADGLVGWTPAEMLAALP